MASDNSDRYKLYVGFPVFFLNVLALSLLVKSTKLSFKIRILSINLCMADTLTCVFLCFPTFSYNFLLGDDLKNFFVLLSATAAFLTITLFNLDRFLAFKTTIYYHRYVSKQKIKASCFVTWIVSIVLSYSQYCTFVGGNICSPEPSTVKRNTVIVGYIRLVLFLTNVVFFGASLHHIKFRLKTMSDHYKCMNQTRTFLKISAITGTFLVLFTPGMIWTILKPNITNPRVISVADIIIGFCFTASFVMDPIWYVLRFRDCRYQLQLLPYVFNKKKQEEIMKLRNEHYASYQISASRIS